MKLWNVFRMEIFKNLNDRFNMFMMLVLMCINIIGSIVIMNQQWLRQPTSFEEMVLSLYEISISLTVIFLFVYPFQMARTDYKNKVMSLMIASGVSRVQYYFVKVGATLLFSFLSFALLMIIPMIIMFNGVPVDTFEIVNFYVAVSGVSIVEAILILVLSWLLLFSTMMTAIIITKGKGSAIFVFFGLFILNGLIMDGLFGSIGSYFVPFISIAVMALIGILVLRRQDL